MDARNYIAQKLKQYRAESGKSAKEIGRLIGKHENTIFAWESGYRQPDAESLILICKAYGKEISDFYDGGADQVERLTEDEARALEIFRQLNASGRDAAIGMLEGLANLRPFRAEHSGDSAATASA